MDLLSYLLLPIFCLFMFPNHAFGLSMDFPMQNPNLFEGDILQLDELDRNAVKEKYRKWPAARIPYVIESDLSSQEKNIRAAMDHYEKMTCIQFVPWTNETNSLRIFAGQGCYSHVGKAIGAQKLSLGRGCYSPGTILHELGHAAGFYHEHSRSDRDDYIVIHWDNIQAGMESEFQKLWPSQNLLLDTFDYDSIMLYGETVFSKNHYLGLKTMTAIDPTIALRDIYDKTELSASDIIRIKKLYEC